MDTIRSVWNSVFNGKSQEEECPKSLSDSDYDSESSLTSITSSESEFDKTYDTDEPVKSRIELCNPDFQKIYKKNKHTIKIPQRESLISDTVEKSFGHTDTSSPRDEGISSQGRELSQESKPPLSLSQRRRLSHNLKLNLPTKLNCADKRAITDHKRHHSLDESNKERYKRLFSELAQPETVDDLAQYFAEIPVKDTNKSCIEAWTIDAIHKNRYNDIVPYDFNRIRLSTAPDYINASRISMKADNYESQQILNCIATQGPVTKTISDFWWMVWSEKMSVIVMLCELAEVGREKCAKYWPDKNESLLLEEHQMKITFTFENDNLQDHKDLTFRLFEITKGSEPSLTVTQFHFRNWVDFGAPKDEQTFVGSLLFVRDHMIAGKINDFIVHCSAGVGRTGTFLLIYYGIQTFFHGKDHVEPLSIVEELRQQRSSMVQSITQFTFACNVLTYFDRKKKMVVSKRKVAN